MNFLHLQLQNDSALGVKVNPEVYLCTLLQSFKKFDCLTLAMIHCKYINNYSRVKAETLYA